VSYYIGIDLGTSAVKAVLTDDGGKIIDSCSIEYPLSSPHPQWSEQNPADWWNAVKECIKNLISGIDKSEVKAIGVAGQMHGLVMTDESGNVLRPAILWNDTRTGKQNDYLNNTVGTDKLRELTGNISFAGFTAPKVLWVKENEPEVFEKCCRICLPKDYINYKLTGEFATDVSDASGTLYFDVAARRWSAEMLAILGIDESYLPKVYESADVIGKTTVCGLSADVVAGAGDNAGAAIGTGTYEAGKCNISLGTSGTVFIPTDSFVLPSNSALHSFCHADGKYHLMGCILSAASCNKWLNETIFAGNYDVSPSPVSAEDTLWFMPYLSGERCPHNDGDVMGAFIGLTHTTSRADMQKAVFEGVSFAIRDCLELCPEMPLKATVCGGGTKSEKWMQILADSLGIELGVISNEGPSYGAALLASGVRPEVRIEKTVKPDLKLKEIYDIKYSKFKKLYPMLKDFYKE
jgi:xylulokinase